MRWALGAFVAFVALAAWLPIAVEAQVIGPGHEAEFSSLLGDLPGGWGIVRVRVEPRRVVYELHRGERAAEVVLLPPASKPPNFRVEVASADAAEADLRDLAAHTRAAIEASDFDPWIAAQQAPRARDGADGPARASSPRRILYGALATAIALAWLALAARRRSLPCAVAALGTALVVAWAWAADDAFITYRYVDQALAGHGLVFNQGERVQGFTHPLWLLLLLGPSLALSPFDASMLVSVACTTGLFATWLRLGRALRWSAWETSASLTAALGCEMFVAFQTGGLENPLGHLLLALLLLSAVEERPRAMFVVAALLLLTRLDYALLALPLLVGVVRELGPRVAWRRARGGIALGLGLLLAWFSFAAIYYGFPLPNTFYAKTGEGWPVGRGLRYLADLAAHEPLPALLLVAGVDALRRHRGPPRWAAAGALLHIGYVVLIGGDYMRGRFLSPALLVAALGVPALLRRSGVSGSRSFTATATLAALSFVLSSRAHEGEFVNERAYHPENQLRHIQDGHVRPHRLPVELPDVALSGRVMARAFTDDPRLVWIDAHGLTDPFIARCPALPGARAGHVERRVPSAYFVARRDARLVPDGEARLRRGDPELARELRALPLRWPSDELARRHRELRLLATGELWAPERLRLIPRYAFSAERLDVPEDAETFAPP